MMSPSHFFDNAFGGSAHGVGKGGLTAAGREMVRRMEARGMLVDIAHASAATIDDVLAIATRPVVASHTGVRGTCRQRPQPVRRARCAAIAATGGVIGIGFWDDRRAAATTRRHRPRDPHASNVAGVGACRARLGLRRRRPGAFDATGLVQLTDALLDAGLEDADDPRKVMGGNAVRVLADVLPELSGRRGRRPVC